MKHRSARAWPRGRTDGTDAPPRDPRPRPVLAGVLARRRALGAAALSLGTTLGPLLALTEQSAEADPRTFLVPRAQEPMPAAARAFRVTSDEGAVLFRQPMADGDVVGRLAYGQSFAMLETRAGRNCRRLWVRVATDAWACGDRGELTADPPAAHTPTPRGRELLPWSYAFTSRDGVRAYHTAEAAVAQSEDRASYEPWEANWGFAIEEVLGVGDERVFRSRSGMFLRRRDVYRAQPTEFAGASFRELAGNEPGVPFGWVALGATFVYPEPSERAEGTPLARLSRVRVYGLEQGSNGRSYARIGPGRYVRADRLRWIHPSSPPESVDVQHRERWIDVDLTSQTLLAYEGATPVYATLVSTGAGAFATPPGEFRIWGRYLAHTMDNTESAHLASHFRLGDVPYVQFFDHDRGLHGVYWHDGFGLARSHGCVNLSPRDARVLFEFTAHPLPEGWVSRAMPANLGTLVRVRGHYAGPEG